jgi:hypothetical protein
MDELTELMDSLLDRRDLIMSNPRDYGASEYKFRLDECRLLMRKVRMLQVKQDQRRLPRVGHVGESRAN